MILYTGEEEKIKFQHCKQSRRDQVLIKLSVQIDMKTKKYICFRSYQVKNALVIK